MPSAWVDRDDRVAGHCPAGPVTDDEQVAKLLDTATWPDADDKMHDAAFQSKVLRQPVGRAINNACGSRDGESLLRCAQLSDADLIQRSERQRGAANRGAAIARTSDIRNIVLHHDNSVRVFWIYEDPNELDPEHAVIRFDDRHKAFWVAARSDLKAAFKRKV